MSRRNFLSLTLVMVLAGALFFTACNKDRTAPVVTMISPENNAVTMGFIQMQARASDDKDIPIVEFYVDGTFQGVDSTGSDSVYTAVWDASAEAMGSQHELKAKAYDLSGNSDSSDVVTIAIGIPAGPTYHRRNIQYPETWDPAGNPHIVAANLTIGSYLTIKPGVQVKVDPGFYVKVGAAGGILARGTADNGITITSSSATPAPGDWHGLEIGAGDNGDSIVLEYCTIEYGGQDTNDAVVVCRGSPLIMNHCTIRNGPGYGIWTSGDNLKDFSANTVTGNYGYGLRIDSRYAAVIAGDNNLAGNGKGIEVTGGIIDKETVWRNPLAPYVMTADLIVGNLTPVRFAVDPGVAIRFRPGNGIFVGQDSSHFGTLEFRGTASEPILLISDSSFPSPGDWTGVNIGQQILPTTAILDYCDIEYAGGNGLGAVYCDSVAVQITNSVIRYSKNFGVRASQLGFASFAGNNVSLCQSYPVSVDPDFVSTVGTNRLDRGLFIANGFARNSATWQYLGYPHVIGGDVEIGGPANPVLQILPGDTVQFTGGNALRIGSVAAGSGALNASGALFTGINQVAGAWKGIEFRELTLNDSSRLVNSTVRYGGGDSLANVVCIGSAPTITGNEIANSAAWGIYIYNSTLDPDTLRAYNTFTGNASGKVGPGGP
jgi:hypothetical protein